MGADQFLLPRLGAEVRVLLDRIVTAGDIGVDSRDAHDWALSRLIELRYVEESSINDTAFVCTSAGRYRWEIEILADEQRKANALQRQVIRQRVDERFSRLGLGTSTALAVCSPMPRLHSGVPARPWRAQGTWKAALAALFAAASVALVAVIGSTEPQDLRDWLFPPTLHTAVAPVDASKASTEQTVVIAAPITAPVDAPKASAEPTALVAPPVAATVTTPADAPKASAERTAMVAAPAAATGAASVDAPIANVERTELVAAHVPVTHTAPVDPDTGQAPATAVISTTAAPALTQQAVAATIDTTAPRHKGGHDTAIDQPAQDTRVPSATLAKVGDDGREGNAAVDRASPDDGGNWNAAATAAALIDSVVSDGREIATDLTTDVEGGFRLIAAAVLRAVADTNRSGSAGDAATQQARDDSPAPAAPATEPPSERGQSATLRPAIASGAASSRGGIVHAMAEQRVTAKVPAAHAGRADDDAQHAAVEQLNALSLSAARRGDVWRPDSPGIVAGRPL